MKGMNISDDIVEKLNKSKAWLEAALEYSGGTHDFDDITKSVLSGEMQLWFGGDAAAITEIIVYPKKKSLHVFLAGGNLDTLMEMYKSAAIWGGQVGCDVMTIAGRKGWQKVFKNDGFEPLCTYLMKEL
jgi:hypothetical protein